MERSAVEVAVLVIAGLIDGCERRAEAMGPLSKAVARAVDELDPDHERDTAPTWLADLPRWAKLDALDRFRKSHDDLLVLEVQAHEIALGLHAMLAPHPVSFTYADDHRRLEVMAVQRSRHLELLRLAEKRLRPRLSADVSGDVRLARRALVAEEVRGSLQLARLRRLLPDGRVEIAS